MLSYYKVFQNHFRSKDEYAIQNSTCPGGFYTAFHACPGKIDDFFRTMNDASGEDLNWFWKEWFYTTWNIDQAITEVRYVKNDPTLRALITVENLREMALPVVAKITEENGKVQTVKLPVEIWQHGPKWIFRYNSNPKIKQVLLDPYDRLPDTDRSNNIYESK